ncbi:MAG: hypothetical protein AAGI38_15260 [Bacteroidota bacterium]
MEVFQVKPLEGIGKIKLGMDQESVTKLMGASEETELEGTQMYSYFDGGFQVFFDEEGKVEFIELLRNSGFQAEAFGCSIFDTPAADVLKVVSQEADYNPNDLEVGYSYVFHELEFSLWRPSIPENESDEEGKYFSTIGIGNQGYYSETSKA